jgi:dTDP-4-dehydrorhamnose reductase
MSFSDDPRPVAITGATGQLGTAFARLIPEARMLGRRDLDLTLSGSVAETIKRLDPCAVINCAAYTNVDGAEQDEQTATVVNGTSVGEMASVTATLGIPFLTFSTDYVFSGDSDRPYVESDDVDPINAYGLSKLVGEHLATANNPNALIVRTSWVVSGTHDNFVATMLRLASDDRAVLRVVDDQRGCPTIAKDLASASLIAMRTGVTGLLHLANGPATTWFDLAEFSVSHSGLGGTVTPCSTTEFPRPAVRPQNSVLGSERLGDMPAINMPPWQESVVEVIDAQMERLSLDS